MDRIITMIIRQLTRRLINTGINKGVDAVANRKGRAQQDITDPAAQKTHQQAQKDSAKRAKQALRIGRKIGRL